jgi:hypothetical protein
MHASVPRIAMLAVAACAGPAPAQMYQFTLNPGSHVSGGLGMAATASGTFIGDYDAATNPGGTRTKPGATGAFDPGENVPVPVTISPTLSGNIDTPATGGWQMSLDTASSLLGLSGLSVTMLGSDPLPMSTGMPFLSEAFRTRNPDSVYNSVQVDIATGTLVHRSVQQVGTAQGELTPLGGGQYSFTVHPTLQLFLTFSVIGDTFEIHGEPVPMTLTGQISLSGASVHLTGTNLIAFEENIFQTGVLPRFGLSLPAVPPSTLTAGVFLDVADPALSAAMNANFVMDATGVPAPGAASMLVLFGIACARRRR